MRANTRDSTPETGARARCIALVLFVVAPLSAGGQEAPEGNDEAEVEYVEQAAVREAASDVFSGPEFRNLPRLDLGPGGTKSAPLKTKQEEREEDSSTPSSPRRTGLLAELIASLFGGAVSMTVVAVLAVVLGTIVALIVLGARRWERSEAAPTKPDADAASDEEADSLATPGDRPTDEWLSAARRAAGAGRFDEALALLLLGAMGHVERAGMIRPRRGLTWRDYLLAVPASSAWHPTLARLIRAYAPVGFGRRPATAETFESLVGPYEQALTAEPTPGVSASLDSRLSTLVS